MYGAICGDIIGSPYELSNVKSTDFPLFGSESTFTDDSVLTAATAQTLLDLPADTKSGRVRAEAYAYHYKQAFSRHPHAGYGQMFSAWARETGLSVIHSYGNGAAMRVTPIGYAYSTLEEVLREARRTCLYTHRHSEAVRGAQAVAAAVFLARTGASKDAIACAAARTAGYDLTRPLSAIRPDYQFDSRTGYSVPPAIRAFLESDDYESAVRLAVSVGGDSDTIACIAGGIAEAFYGGVPKPIADGCWSRLDSGLKKTVQSFRSAYGLRE